MGESNAFKGFHKEGIQFLMDLAFNNRKDWFNDHREVFEEHLLAPAQGFVITMGERLKDIAPEIQADPRVDKSIFRIYRDTRFSKDKSPFKTHIGVLLWEGTGHKLENSGFYFHLEPPKLMIGVGLLCFTKPTLEEYRKSVIHPKHGKELAQTIQKFKESKDYQMGEKHYKKIPRGFDPNHENAEYLLYNGLTVGVEEDIPDDLYSGEIINYCYDRFKDMAPLHKWLHSMTQRAGKS